MKIWKHWCVSGAALSLCAACHSGPADAPVQVVKDYYASGQLQQTRAVQHGQLNGPVVSYYRNGARQETAHFVRGRAVGSRVLFDSTGKPLERHVYDSTGRMFFVQGYDKQGRPSSTSLLPLVTTPDTVPAGHPFAGSIRFGYALKHPAVLLVGTFTNPKGVKQPVMLDTLQRVKQHQDGSFYFSYRPARAGYNTFAYRFVQPESRYEPSITGSREDDSLGVDYLTGKRPFYVK